jgi:chemotaxis protein methyltransferase CheR
MLNIQLSEQEFAQFRDFIFRNAGIALSPAKKPLVWGRLNKRLQHYNLNSFSEYFRLIMSGTVPEELQMAIDLLTTNETYFFRERDHFDFLRKEILGRRHENPFRVWSAACSSGEEPYSIAMVLADCLGMGTWEIVASDISKRVLQKAQSGLYPMERSQQHLPADYMRRFCLKGTGEYDGMLLVDRSLRDKIRFSQVNLIAPLVNMGKFDVVFLRNVLIYFNLETKRQVIERLVRVIKPDGYLIVGHSESLAGLTECIAMERPSIYRHAS